MFLFEILKKAQDDGWHKVYVEVVINNNATKARFIDPSKSLGIIKAQLYILEPYNMPTEKVIPAKPKPRQKKQEVIY